MLKNKYKVNILKNFRDSFQILLENTLNPIMVVDADGNYVYGNQAALEFLEIKLDDLTEKDIWDFVPAGQLEKQKKEHAPFFNQRILEKDYCVNGKIKTLLLNVIPFTSDGKKYMYGIGQDITEIKANEKELSKSKESYEKIFEESPVPMWEEDFSEVKKALENMDIKESNKLKKKLIKNPEILENLLEKIKVNKVNKAAVDLYGAKNKEDFKDGITDFLSINSRKNLIKEIIAINNNMKIFESNIINKTFAGDEKTFYLKLAVLPKYEKTFSKAIVSMLDVSKAIDLEKKLKKEGNKGAEFERKYMQFFENSRDGMYLCKKDGTFLDANKALLKMLGIENMEELKKKSIKDFYIKDSYKKFPHEQNGLMEAKLKNKKGKNTWVEFSAKSVDRLNGVCYEGIVRDITERKKYESKIRRLSFTDKLTGLYNREYFEEELKRLNKKRQLPLSIIMGDVNGLKFLNETFGYAIGDRLLKNIAEIMKETFRKEDIIARWGGDEFVVLLPKTSNAISGKITRRIKKNAKGKTIKKIPISISFGTATKEKPGQEIDEIIMEAENRLHKTKLLEGRSVHSSIISELTNTLKEKSFETERHTDRLKKLSIKLGEKADLTSNQLDDLSLAASLHDIGKIGIPDNILLKKGKLDKKEWEHMKRHSEIGYKIANSSSAISSIAEYILYHHERWDGKGYPQGLKGEDMPIISRIISIVDAYDVMTHKRTYKPLLPKEEAKKELKNNAGSQFDPGLIKKFLKILEQEQV